MTTTFTSDPIRVVDVDSHMTEPAWLWVDHAPAKYKERVPRILEDENGRPYWVVDGKRLGALGFTAVGPDGKRIEGETGNMHHRFEDLHKGAYDFQARLGWLDERGIDQQVMFPNVPGFGASKFFNEIADEELRTACVTTYNDAAAAIQQESGGRLLPLALVPWWDREATLKEVRRVRNDLGLRGLTMCDGPHHFGFPSLDQPEWAPFWSTCEDLELAVAFHIGSGRFGKYAWGQEGAGEYQATITSNSFLNNSWIVSNLVFSGVLLRHPRLKIFSAETGVGWLPFFVEAMDYQWRENLLPQVRREVWKEALPSELVRRNMYVSFWFEHTGLLHALDVLGEDCIMFETDFPHGTALTDRMTEQVAGTLAGFTPEVRRKLLRGNAARLYSLD